MKGRLLGVAVLVLFGLVRLPVESRMEAERRELNMGEYRITASLRQQAGQAGFLAVLGGLRAAVADLMWIRAHIAWQDVQYGRMKLYFDTCLALQPRRETFYEMAAWHMAWNGAAWIERSERDPVVRQRQMREFYKVGEDYLLQGVANAPGSWVLWDNLGAIYRDKFKDPCRAAEAYAEAAKRPGHLDYVRRFAVYFLAECPGREQEAYEKLLALYHIGEDEWLPTLLAKLQLMERKLDIPRDRRVYIPPKYRLPE